MLTKFLSGTLSKDIICNIASGRCNIILKQTATTKHITVTTKMFSFYKLQRCTCSVNAVHSIITVN